MMLLMPEQTLLIQLTYEKVNDIANVWTNVDDHVTMNKR